MEKAESSRRIPLLDLWLPALRSERLPKLDAQKLLSVLTAARARLQPTSVLHPLALHEARTSMG
jgi:hypothetical protein